uniref:Uncharacterized protein n=1 Tax=Trichobilharzia regenti TaxID=157069 RepID=A0AA85J0R2_TRIRE|nr:unnamed protein product [Trichobilharzia regenti]
MIISSMTNLSYDKRLHTLNLFSLSPCHNTGRELMIVFRISNNHYAPGLSSLLSSTRPRQNTSQKILIEFKVVSAPSIHLFKKPQKFTTKRLTWASIQAFYPILSSVNKSESELITCTLSVQLSRNTQHEISNLYHMSFQLE